MPTNQHNNSEVETEMYSETATAIFRNKGVILVFAGRPRLWLVSNQLPQSFLARHNPIRGHAKSGHLILSIGIFLAVVADANLLFIKRHSGAEGPALKEAGEHGSNAQRSELFRNSPHGRPQRRRYPDSGRSLSFALLVTDLITQRA